MKLLQTTLSDRKISIIEFSLILVTAVIPLFLIHPYRINLFLAWEGAFRMSNGEIPYRDFGTPVGYGFWILPAIFFKIFGPYVYTLLVFQTFVNIGSGLIFRAFLKLFNVTPGVRFLTLLVYCMSYSMFNFWPWYNHLVFIFEMTGLYLLCQQVLKPLEQRNNFKVIGGAFLIALSFMTKQDTGALALFISIIILAFDYIFDKRIKTPLVFMGAYVVSMIILIVPFLQYEFSYWFNMGQFPHNARVDKFDIVNEFLGASDSIKFYLVIFAAVVIVRFQEIKNWKDEKGFFLFALIVLCILGQASIIQVTSYTPIDGNIYYHSFAFAFIVYHFTRQIQIQKLVPIALFSGLVLLWWSGVFWTRFLKDKVQNILISDAAQREKSISKRTYLITADTLKSNRSKWVVPDIASFKRIKVPEGTAKGINDVLALPESKKPDLKILNLSELTPLAFDMGYTLERGPAYPLWFHKGVSFFDREVAVFCERINRKEFDLILFEDIPNVNNFYPYELRTCIQENYSMKFKFTAPRIPEISYIEVYTKD